MAKIAEWWGLLWLIPVAIVATPLMLVSLVLLFSWVRKGVQKKKEQSPAHVSGG